MPYDLILFYAIYGLAGRSAIVDGIGIFFADYLPYALGLALWLFLLSKKYRSMGLLAIGSGLVARFLIKIPIVVFYPRPRPYVALPWIQKLVWMPGFDNFQSFPSGHALFFFAASTVIYFYNKKLGVFFFVCSAAMGFCRVFVGVHWPSDIMSGALLGTATGLAVYWLYKNELIWIGKSNIKP